MFWQCHGLVALLGGTLIPNQVSQEAGPLIFVFSFDFLCNLVGLYYTPLWRSMLVVWLVAKKCHCGVNVCAGFKKLREVAKVTFGTNKMQQFRLYIIAFALLFTARRFYSSLAVYLFAVDWRMDVTNMFFAIILISLASTCGALLVFFVSRVKKMSNFSKLGISVLMFASSITMIYFVPHGSTFVFLLCILFGLANGVFDIEANVLVASIVPSTHIGSFVSLASIVQCMFRLVLPIVNSYSYNRFGSYSAAFFFCSRDVFARHHAVSIFFSKT